MNTDDNPWLELTRIARRSGPRYARGYGTCATCGFGASSITAPAGFWWCRCFVCDTVWPCPVQEFLPGGGSDPNPDVDDDEELQAMREELVYAEMCALADCHRFDAQLSQPEGVFMKTETTKMEPGVMSDHWAGALAVGAKCNNDPNDPAAPPADWPELSLRTRECICHAVRNDPHKLGAWRLIRARFLPAAEMGENPATEAILAPLYLPDFEQRHRWQTAAAEIAMPGISHQVLRTVESKLSNKDAMLTSLRGQRAAIDAEIARLEQHQQVVR